MTTVVQISMKYRELSYCDYVIYSSCLLSVLDNGVTAC